MNDTYKVIRTDDGTLHQVAQIDLRKPPPDGMIDFLTDGARRVGKTMTEPDDDWIPVWLMAVTEETAIAWSSTAHKHKQADFLARQAAELGALGVANLYSSWIASAHEGTRKAQRIEALIGEHGSLTDVPVDIGVREAVVVNCFMLAGIRTRMAYIHRSTDAPPRLGPFRLMGESLEAEGRMIDGLRIAMEKRPRDN